jgi:putative membrane protein
MRDVLLLRNRLALVAALSSAVLLGACNRGDRAGVDTAVSDTTGAIAAGADTVAGRVAGREYTNAELVALINTYNDAEVEVGKMAQTKATDPQVRAFARRIVGEHQALKTEVTNTAKQGNITPAMPDDDEDLTKDHQDGMRDLNGKAKGKEFDEAFLEHEIKMHKKVLDEVDDALGRNRNPEIRPLLEKARTGLSAHLKAAEDLEKKFGAV